MSRSRNPKKRLADFKLESLPSQILPSIAGAKIDPTLDEKILTTPFDTDTDMPLSKYKKWWKSRPNPNHLLILGRSVIKDIEKELLKTSKNIVVVSINHEPYNIIIDKRSVRKRLGNIAQFMKPPFDEDKILYNMDESINSEATVSAEANDLNERRVEDPTRPYLIILNKLGYFDKKGVWHKTPHTLSLKVSGLDGGTRRQIKYRRTRKRATV
jgi:hypothetical protein